MNEIIKEENINIENMIYKIRGVEVMLDSDLAKLYHCANGTKDINKAVKRNIIKFPEDFYFQLTDEEVKDLRFQNGTANSKSRYNPYVFTEQGVAMLSSVLHTEIAAQVSVRIMRTFVKIRHYIRYHDRLLPNKMLLLEHKVNENTEKINELFDMFDPKEIIKEFIFFKNEFYDAYSVIIDIFTKARNEIIIIDNYAGKELLDILKDIDKKIIIVTPNIDKNLREKYESQYNNVTFIHNEEFHDRFIILDRYRLFSCGSSLKDVGKKCFAINEFNNPLYVDEILKIINIKD